MSNNSNTQITLHFLMNTDFSYERGYSYGELINYLKTYQLYYRECYANKDKFEQELLFKNKTFDQSENRILNLEKLLKEKENDIGFLMSKISRKLTFWERVTGKIKIKY